MCNVHCTGTPSKFYVYLNQRRGRSCRFGARFYLFLLFIITPLLSGKKCKTFWLRFKVLRYNGTDWSHLMLSSRHCLFQVALAHSESCDGSENWGIHVKMW